jgi:hypothetical protein
MMANEVLGNVSRVFDWHATRGDTFRSPIVKGLGESSFAGPDRRRTLCSVDRLR